MTATATAALNGDLVGPISVTDGGFGYTSVPQVTLVGGGGTGATATAVLTDGVVTGINVTNPGTGYTSPPTVTVASPSGTMIGRVIDLSTVRRLRRFLDIPRSFLKNKPADEIRVKPPDDKDRKPPRKKGDGKI